MKSSLTLLRNSLPIFCVNCVHYIPHKMPQFGQCKLFPQKNNYLITGEIKVDKIKYSYCSTTRKYDHMCGESGKNYEDSMNNNPK